MSGLSEAAKALLLSMAEPAQDRPPDSVTVAEAAKEWGVAMPCASARLMRARDAGRLASTKIGNKCYYHAPAKSPRS